MPIKELKHTQLFNSCNPSSFSFKSTEDFKFEYEPLHQERGVKAIDFALNIKSEGFNLFVCGPTGTGRNTQVKKVVYELAANLPVPDDWIYVYNFSTEDEPIAINLPSGTGKTFCRDIKEMVEELKIYIQKAFESEDYEKSKHDLLKDYKEKRDLTFQQIEDEAFKKGFVLKQTATGVILVPRIKDRAITPEEYEQLSQDEKELVEKEKNELHVRIDQVLNEIRNLEKDAKVKIRELDKEITLFSVRHTIDELRFKYRENRDLVKHLDRLQEDVLANIDLFKAVQEEQVVPFVQTKANKKEDALQKYMVNLLIDNSCSRGAPVIIEHNPTYYNLIGRIEYVASFGAMTTDFTKIAPGALHKANGGFLILQAMDVIKAFMAWEALKRVIRDHEIKVEDINEQYRVISTTSLKPKPIPSNVKIVMVGPSWIYQMLFLYDEEFRKMFKVRADFDYEMDRDKEKMQKYAAFIKVRCETEKLRHLKRNAVAKIVDYGSRVIGKQNKLSARFMHIADILREADYWAGKESAENISVKHIEKAIEEKVYRSNIVEEKLNDLMDQDIILIDVAGSRVAQINGLAVYDMGDYMFGKPTRITASVFAGQTGIVDIERQSKMGGNVHSKGVLILNGYLGEKYAQDYPLSLSSSICFEQSYDGVDGDSASSTEAYCILSALSGKPIDQGIAVTGSMNQHGDIQPIGGVNQKIEGFYHICKIKGLTGKQGVVIPKSNMSHLMLKQEVVNAVKDKKFHIWAISSIDEGIEILTGTKAGKKNEKGKYPKGSIHDLVLNKLFEFYSTKEKRKNAKKSSKTKK